MKSIQTYEDCIKQWLDEPEVEYLCENGYTVLSKELGGQSIFYKKTPSNYINLVVMNKWDQVESNFVISEESLKLLINLYK